MHYCPRATLEIQRLERARLRFSMAFPFEVCNVCLDKYGKIKHKVQSLVELRCLRQPNPHKGVTVRVRIVDGILEPRVRPMAKVFFRGYFVYCDPDRCIGERCTFPHCSKEKEEWNAQKFSISVSSPPVSGPTSSPSIPVQPVSTDSTLLSMLGLCSWKMQIGCPTACRSETICGDTLSKFQGMSTPIVTLLCMEPL